MRVAIDASCSRLTREPQGSSIRLSALDQLKAALEEVDRAQGPRPPRRPRFAFVSLCASRAIHQRVGHRPSDGPVEGDDCRGEGGGPQPRHELSAWDFYRIRGFDASFNTYVDGLRGGNGMAEETFGLESVEVLKGPSSTLYGESVLGGIVNLRSKVPRPDAFAQVQFTGGSYGFYEPAIDAGTSLNRSHTLYARINLLYRSTDSFVDYVTRHRMYVAPALTWEPGNQFDYRDRRSSRRSPSSFTFHKGEDWTLL